MRAQTEKTNVNRQSTHVDGHILLCTHVPNLHVPKHIGRPMSGLFRSMNSFLVLNCSACFNFSITYQPKPYQKNSTF